MPPSTFLERQSTAIRAPDAAKLLTNDTLSFLAHARSADDQVSAPNTMATRRCTGLRTQGPLASQGRSYLGGLLVESGIALVAGLLYGSLYLHFRRVIAPSTVDRNPAFPRG